MENASKALIIAGSILIAILLISIGIILINSGRDVVETGTAGMKSQKIQTFNSQFTPYEGIKKGSEIKGLKNVIRASNAIDEEHQIQVTFNQILEQSDSNVHYLGKDFWTAEFKPTKNYKVVLSYYDGDEYSMENGYISENGYICDIYVVEEL